MKVYYIPSCVVDCTSDPHPVNYDALPEMLADIVRVCESDMVQAVRSVLMTFAHMEYESDWYSDYDNGKRAESEGDMAEKHKTAGLYFGGDAGVPPDRHLPPGLTGLKEAAKVALSDPDAFDCISIGVVWSFAGDASCSDYIEIGEGHGRSVVNFGSQDWWIEKEEYLPWCQQMADFLSRPFPYYIESGGHHSAEMMPNDKVD